jgi:hypothetical protein
MHNQNLSYKLLATGYWLVRGTNEHYTEDVI